MGFRDYIDGALDGFEQGYIDIRKELEKAMISSFCAPSIKAERKSIANQYDEDMSTTAVTTKTAVMTVSYQLDTAIKGSGRTAIETVLEDKLSDFDEI